MLGVSTFWTQLNKAMGCSQRVFNLLDLQLEEVSTGSYTGLTKPLTGKIDIQNVEIFFFILCYLILLLVFF